MDMYGYVRICMDMYVHADVAALDALVDPHAMPWRSKLQTEYGVYHLGWVGGPWNDQLQSGAPVISWLSKKEGMSSA